MKRALFVLILLSTQSWADDPLGTPLRTSWSIDPSGYYGSCALIFGEIHCWGDDGFGVSTVPPLKNPKQISISSTSACALDDTGVQCWGKGFADSGVKIPPLKNPTHVSRGYPHACALHDDGVTCWGANPEGETDVPRLVRPKQVVAGAHRTCAIHEGGLTCWGSKEYGTYDIPPLKNPRQVSIAGRHICALDDEGVHCWEEKGRPLKNTLQLKNPTQLTSGGYHTCALDDDGVKCWLNNTYSVYAWDAVKVPPLKNPTQISAKGDRTCAVHERGIQCWGNGGINPAKVPASIQSRWRAHQLEFNTPPEYLIYLSQNLPRVRAQMVSSLLERLGRIESQFPSSSETKGPKLLLVNALIPFVADFTSDVMEKDFKPDFIRGVRDFSKVYGVRTIADIPQTPETTLMALEFTQAALQSLRLYAVSDDDRSMFEELLTHVGNAIIAKPSNPQDPSVRAVLEQIDLHRPLMERLRASYKTQGITLSMDAAIGYLRRQHS